MLSQHFHQFKADLGRKVCLILELLYTFMVHTTVNQNFPSVNNLICKTVKLTKVNKTPNSKTQAEKPLGLKHAFIALPQSLQTFIPMKVCQRLAELCGSLKF